MLHRVTLQCWLRGIRARRQVAAELLEDYLDEAEEQAELAAAVAADAAADAEEAKEAEDAKKAGEAKAAIEDLKYCLVALASVFEQLRLIDRFSSKFDAIEKAEAPDDGGRHQGHQTNQPTSRTCADLPN